MFKISRGFSSKLKLHNSVNLAIGRACLYEHFCACQLYFKKPGENQNIDHLDHLYEAILCDWYYVFRGLARWVALGDAGWRWVTLGGAVGFQIRRMPLGDAGWRLVTLGGVGRGSGVSDSSSKTVTVRHWRSEISKTHRRVFYSKSLQLQNCKPMKIHKLWKIGPDVRP